MSALPAHRPPSLVALHVGDRPESWAAVGFEVVGRTVAVGDVQICLHGDDGPRGLLRWDLRGGTGAPHRRATVSDLDGLSTGWVPDGGHAAGDDGPDHPNGISSIDHVVIASADVDRTIEAMISVGFEVRREGHSTSYGEPMRQVFFWAGDVIVELVGPTGPPTTKEQEPARFFGLAFTSEDLDGTAAALPDDLGTPKPAIQQGRSIASLRLRNHGGSVECVVMSPHPGVAADG
ncbi:MAG: VOC family protein [Microthrixaceae bacterium]